MANRFVLAPDHQLQLVWRGGLHGVEGGVAFHIERGNLVTGLGGGTDDVGDVGKNGGGGACAIELIDVSAVSSETVTVGSGGAGGNNVGGNGGSSSFGSHCSAGGGTGTRMNYFDPGSGQWVQVWMGSGFLIDIRGGLVDGSMTLTGHIDYLANATRKSFRGTWTALEDGRVRQFFEESPDDGKTWTPWFEGFYVRGEAPAGE